MQGLLQHPMAVEESRDLRNRVLLVSIIELDEAIN